MTGGKGRSPSATPETSTPTPDTESPEVRCANCGMVGHVTQPPLTTAGEVIMKRAKRISYQEYPDVYIYPGPDMDEVEPSPQTTSKMAAPELIWSKASYTMTTLMQKYSDKFPVIVKVNSGYYGKYHIDTLASCQVARLHTWCMQERVMARTSRGRLLSIPLHYEIDFEVLTRKSNKKVKKSKPRKLRSIVHDHQLPVEVQLRQKPVWHFRIGSERHSSKDFGTLEIIKVYQQRYLKGNTIHNGVIDTKVMLLPMYINATFKVAIGAKNQTEEEWRALQTMYTNAVSHIDFSSIKGSRDMYEYPANLEPIKKEDLTDDEDEDSTDANANLTKAENRENLRDTTNPQTTQLMNGHVKTTLNGDTGSSTLDLRQTKNEVISIPLRHNMVMQVAKDDLHNVHNISNGPEQRSLLRSDMSDYSSVSGHPLRKHNVVRVSLGDDAQVITQEMYDRDFGHAGPLLRHQPPSVNGSTIINVTNDDSHIISPHSMPSYYNSMARSETNLRRTFSDQDFHDNSVFLPSSLQYQEEFPSYTTRRRYKQSFPSFSSSDVSRVPRYGRKKYGQVLVGGAPLGRQYHSMNNLSRIDMVDSGVSRVDSGVSRVASFRSATMTPSPSPTRHRSPSNLYVRLTDDQPTDRYIKRIEFRENPPTHVTYTRRAGVEPASRVAKQVRTTTRESSFNKGVYITDGNRNYHAPKRRRAPPPPPPPTYHDEPDFVELIEEDYTQTDIPVYTRPPMASPVMSSSSTEDSKRYFIMYENGSHEEPVVTEATENGEFIYQGSMMLRKGRDFDQLSVGSESMIEIPVEDLRARTRSVYSSTSMREEPVTLHNHRREESVHVQERRPQGNWRRSYPETVERQPITHGRRVEQAEYFTSQMRGAYDEVDDGEYIEVQHADMTKGAADHWGRVMDTSVTESAHSRHHVPVELEGRSRGINESMFEGGHHSFTQDRDICRRLEARRHERNLSHREHSLNLARRQRYAGHGVSRSHGRDPHVVVVNRTSAPLSAGMTSMSSYGTGGSSYAAGGSSYEVGSSGGIGRDRGGSFEFRSSRNEVWSNGGQGFGVAPLTTSEQETSALLKRAEGHDESESPDYHHTTTTTSGHHEVSKGSTSSYVDSSLDSSHDGEMVATGEMGEGGATGGEKREVTTASYDLTMAEVAIEKENDPPKVDDAGPAAAAAAAAMADGNLDIHSDERISRKMARELTRSGSVRSLREVYARSRSPSSSQRDKPSIAVAPASEVFADILNKPTTSNQSMTRKSETTTVTTTKSRTSADGNVILRNKAGRGAVGNATTSAVSREGNPGDNELAWQETQSYHLESIRDSIRDLDEYLKNQGGESDAQSLSSAASSKHLEHFSYALTEDPTTY